MNEELLYNQLHERTKEFGRTQFIKELMRLERENNQLKERIRILTEHPFLSKIRKEDKSVLKELRSWLEDWKKMLETDFSRDEFEDGNLVAIADILSKLNELEGKND